MLDLVIVLTFVAYSVTVGFRAKKLASRGLGDYFLAGRELRGWQAGTSMAATQFAADTPLLVAGLIATGGVFLVWRLWIYGLAFLLMGFLFAAHWLRSGVITDAELTEIRYSGRGVLALRAVKAIYYGTVINCAVLAMVLVAAVGIAEATLPWHAWLPEGLYGPLVGFVQWTGVEITAKLPFHEPDIATANNIISILLIVAFTALYSMTGGLRGVVATDLVQFSLAIVGTIFFAYFLVREIGGFGAITPALVDHYGAEKAGELISFAPEWSAAILPFLTIIGLQWFFQVNSDGTGYLAQRSMACANEGHARWAGVIFAWLQILLRSLPWLVIGVGLLVVYPFTVEEAQGGDFAASRELLFVTGMNDLLPPGIRGLLLTGMLAALASTLDTHMNWGASYWSNDLYNRFICREWLKREPSGRELVIVARLSNLVILAIALIVMLDLDSIQDAWQITLLFGAGVGSVLILRWVWERINLWSEIAAMAVSLCVAPILLWLGKAAEAGEWFGPDAGMTIDALQLATMAAVSTAAAIGVTWFTAPTDEATLRVFYERVRPAGWWGRAATAAGDDPAIGRRRLRSEVATTLLTACSLFLCLYGAGRLLIPHPDVWWGWATLALLVGVGLVPVWARRAMRAGAGDQI